MVGSKPVALGIESSCDETGTGLVRDGVLLGVASSMDEHARFGGMVPEIAARAHVHAVAPVVREALDRAGPTLGDVGAVAVTTGPGLFGALQVGVAAAKGYAFSLGVPLYGVHHLAAAGGPGRSAPGRNRPAPASVVRSRHLLPPPPRPGLATCDDCLSAAPPRTRR
ncbi:hypothetical protein ACFC1R_13775 [Kitasatospora sp. NPDC056138]|uniref:hypothetical protein n=1 Tax=Kitasatospora sp. NPDC056138 TaxID=3345724 RepID=UPI0035D6105B